MALSCSALLFQKETICCHTPMLSAVTKIDMHVWEFHRIKHNERSERGNQAFTSFSVFPLTVSRSGSVAWVVRQYIECKLE